MYSRVNVTLSFIHWLYCLLTSLFPYSYHHIILNIPPSSIDSIIVIMSFWRLRSSFSKSTWLKCFDSLSCIWENRNKKPPTASHNLQTEKVHKQKCRVQIIFCERFVTNPPPPPTTTSHCTCYHYHWYYYYSMGGSTQTCQRTIITYLLGLLTHNVKHRTCVQFNSGILNFFVLPWVS
jgi:hypothetical protein